VAEYGADAYARRGILQVDGLACIMLVNTHLLYPLLLDAVMKKNSENTDHDKESSKSLLTWAQVLKAVATFAVPIFITIIILKLAGC
jgi:hypothetical protein